MRALVRFCCQGQLSAECEHPRWTLIFFKGCKFGGLKFKKSDLQILALVKKKNIKMLDTSIPTMQFISLLYAYTSSLYSRQTKQNKKHIVIRCQSKAAPLSSNSGTFDLWRSRSKKPRAKTCDWSAPRVLFSFGCTTPVMSSLHRHIYTFTSARFLADKRP